MKDKKSPISNNYREIIDTFHDIAEKLKKIKIHKWAVAIALVSLISSVAFGFFNLDISNRALEISEDAHKAIEPFQKPILSIRDSKLNYSIIESNGTEIKIRMNIIDHEIIESDEGVTLNINLDINKTVVNISVDYLLVNINFNIVNEGNGIAKNTRMFFTFLSLDETISDDKRIINNANTSFANNIYPDVDIPFGLSFNISDDAEGIKELISGEEMGIIIKFDCIDFASGKEVVETIWCKM